MSYEKFLEDTKISYYHRAAYALDVNLLIGPEQSTLIIPTPSGAKSPKFQEAINNIRKDERVIVASFLVMTTRSCGLLPQDS